MNGYFYTLLVTSVCGAICVLMTWGGFEKYMKYVAALVCLAVMILPLRDMKIETSEDFELSNSTISLFETGLYKTSVEITEERVGNYISEIVFQKFGIKPISADINIEWTENEAVITSVSVSFSKTDSEKSHLARDYLCEMLGGEVELVEVEQLS